MPKKIKTIMDVDQEIDHKQPPENTPDYYNTKLNMNVFQNCYQLRQLPFSKQDAVKQQSKRYYRPMIINIRQFMISQVTEPLDCFKFITSSESNLQQFLLQFQLPVDEKIKKIKDLCIFNKHEETQPEETQITENTQSKQKDIKGVKKTQVQDSDEDSDDSTYYSHGDDMYEDDVPKKEMLRRKQKQKHQQPSIDNIYAHDQLQYNADTSFYRFIMAECLQRHHYMMEEHEFKVTILKQIADQCVQRRQELQTIWLLKKISHNKSFQCLKQVPAIQLFLHNQGIQLKQIQNEVTKQQYYLNVRKQKIDYYLQKTNQMCEHISQKINSYKNMEVPFLIDHTSGQLRPYQIYGMKFLLACTELNYNCLLADDLGLGKSLQTIALISQLAVNKIHGPHLIVVPSTLIYNWEQEFKKWAPFANVVVYYGSKQEREKLRSGWSYESHSTIILTSYNVAVIDQSFLRRKNFYYLILDEAHLIRNSKSKAWNSLLDIRSSHKLLISGTPISNTSTDIWSLLHFVLPGIFSSRQEFLNLFARDIEKMADGELAVNRDIIKWIHQLLRPFMLRRLKQEVESELPCKTEFIVPCPLTRTQLYLYSEFINTAETQRTIRAGNYLNIVNVLTSLRKICNHPRLLEDQQIKHSLSLYDGVYSWKHEPAIKVNYSSFEVLLRILRQYQHVYQLLTYNLIQFKSPISNVNNSSNLMLCVDEKQNTSIKIEFSEKQIIKALNYYEQNVLQHFPKTLYNQQRTYFCAECGCQKLLINQTFNISNDYQHRVKCSYVQQIDNQNLNSYYLMSLKDQISRFINLQNLTFKQQRNNSPKQLFDYQIVREENYMQNLFCYQNMVLSNKFQYNQCNNCINDTTQNNLFINICNNLTNKKYNMIDSKISDKLFEDPFQFYYQKQTTQSNSILSIMRTFNQMEIGRNNMSLNNTDITNKEKHDIFEFRGQAFSFISISSQSYIYDSDLICQVQEHKNSIQQYDNQPYLQQLINNQQQNENAKYQQFLNTNNLQKQNLINTQTALNQVIIRLLSKPFYSGNLHQLINFECVFNINNYISEFTYKHYIDSVHFRNKVGFKSLQLFNIVQNLKILEQLPLLNIYLENCILNYQALIGFDQTLIGLIRHNNYFLNNYLNGQEYQSQMQFCKLFMQSYPNHRFYMPYKQNELTINANIKLMKTCKHAQFYNCDNQMDIFIQKQLNLNYKQVFQHANNNNNFQQLEKLGYFCQNTVEPRDDEILLKQYQQKQYLLKLNEHEHYLPRTLIPDINCEQLNIDLTENYGESNNYLNTTMKALSWRTQYNAEKKQQQKDRENPTAEQTEEKTIIKQENVTTQQTNQNNQQDQQQQSKNQQKPKLIKLIKKLQVPEIKLSTFNPIPILHIAVPRLSTMSVVDLPINQQLLFRNPKCCLPTIIGHGCQSSFENQLQQNSFSYNVHQFSFQKKLSPFNFLTPEQFYNAADTLQVNEAINYNQYFALNTQCVNSCKSFKDINSKYFDMKLQRNIQLSDKADLIQQSGKLLILQRLLQKLYSENSKVLIFTQQHKMLDILELFLNHQNYQFFRMDGSTKPRDRQDLVNRFNTNKLVFAFIMTTRTGGIGLNLTGADVVIFVDTDWNPQIHQQATDRVHRINQIKEVKVYTLLSEYTCEENIVRRATQKKHLDKLILRDGVFLPEYFEKDSNFDEKVKLRFEEQENKINLVYVNLINLEEVKSRLGDVLDAYQDDDDKKASQQLMKEWLGDMDEIQEQKDTDETFIETSKQIIDQLQIYSTLEQIPQVYFKFFENGFNSVAAWQQSQQQEEQIYGFQQKELDQIQQAEEFEQLQKQFIIHEIDKKQLQMEVDDLKDYARHELQEDVKIMDRIRKKGPRRVKSVEVRTIEWVKK